MAIFSTLHSDESQPNYLSRHLIPTLRVSGAKRAPHLPRQGARPKDLYIAFGSLLGRFGMRAVPTNTQNSKTRCSG